MIIAVITLSVLLIISLIINVFQSLFIRKIKNITGLQIIRLSTAIYNEVILDNWVMPDYIGYLICKFLRDIGLNPEHITIPRPKKKTTS